MADRLFSDGGELGHAGLWSSGMSVAEDYVFDGSYSLAPGVVGAVLDGLSVSEFWGAFRFYKQSNPCTYLLTPRVSGSIVATLQITGGGLLEVRRGNTVGTLLATGTTVLSNDTWYLIEYHYKADDTNGRWEVKVNGGSIEIDYTGDTTSGGTTITDLYLYPGTTCRYDNFIIDGTSWVGDTRIQGRKVTGPGNSTQWTPSTGSNWACVDDVPPNDSEYISINTADQVDLYTLEDLVGSIASVKAVQLVARAMKEGSPTPQQIALMVRTGSTDYASADKALTISLIGHANIWNENPNTSSAWTTGDVNGAQVGVKSRA